MSGKRLREAFKSGELKSKSKPARGMEEAPVRKWKVFMSALIQPTTKEIFYPESDGLPMADNTRQFEWIVTIKEGLDVMLPNDFVAGNLFWYPVEEKPKIYQAPDALVALGRPKGDRSSYRQWEEDNIAPQVVFEILPPSNTATEMLKKLGFYEKYGVSEYYIYDPETNDLFGWERRGDKLTSIEPVEQWVSPLLGIRFETAGGELRVYRPDGRRFETYAELEHRAEQDRLAKEAAEASAEQERIGKEAAQAQARLFAEKLRELGIDPETLGK